MIFRDIVHSSRERRGPRIGRERVIEISEQGGGPDPKVAKESTGCFKNWRDKYYWFGKIEKRRVYLYLKLEPVQWTERIHESAVRRRGELDEQLGPAGRGHWNGLAGSAEPQQNRISGRVPVVNGHKVRHVVTLAPVLQTRW